MRRRWGHGWQWERIQSCNSTIRLKAPRRKNSWTASRSPHTEAPLLLLLHVLQVNPDLLLLCLHHPDTLPVQQWRSRLLLYPPQLLSLRAPGIGLLDGEQTRQRQSFLLGQHQLKSKKSSHPASSSTSPFPPRCLSAGVWLHSS